MPPRYENELNPLLDFKVKKSFKSRYNQDEFFLYIQVRAVAREEPGGVASLLERLNPSQENM